MTRPAVDVVISTGGRFDMLEKCLISIYANATIPITITVIDDGSDKEKKAKYPHLFNGTYKSENVLKFVTRRNEVAKGFSAASNYGASVGKAPIICFMNDDIELKEGYFTGLDKVMKDETIGICGAKLLFPESSVDRKRPGGKVQHIGVALNVVANAVHPMVGWSADNKKTCKSREVLAVTGALLAVRRNIFRTCGGFDMIYGKGYWEDIDLCLKVRGMGYKVLVDTNLLAYHYTGASSEIDKSFARDFQKNAMIFRSRWAGSGLLIPDDWSY